MIRRTAGALVHTDGQRHEYKAVMEKFGGTRVPEGQVFYHLFKKMENKETHYLYLVSTFFSTSFSLVNIIPEMLKANFALF